MGAVGLSHADLVQVAGVFALALLQATGTIQGTVVDASGGAPLARVSVRLQSTGQTLVTDDQGRFLFAGVVPGYHELYVSAVNFMLVKRIVTVTAGGDSAVTIPLAEGTGVYTEIVHVRGAAPPRADPVVAAAQTLGSSELQQLRGVLMNDPMRAVQVMPGVAAGDDFRSEFSVRGLGVPQMNFTFEGISTAFLVHTVQQIRETGSVAMVNGDVLDEVSLLSGVYPQRHGNRLGAEIDFRMRDGSRERVQSHVSVSATDAAGVVEGPIGRSSRGSWLVTGRKSYLDMVLKRIYPDQEVGFGFSDAQARLVYDVTPRQQLQFSITGGQSRLDRNPGHLDAFELQTGDNASVVAVLGWRYLPSPRLAWTQRVAFTANGFRNTSVDRTDLDRGRTHDVVYRSDWSYAPAARVTVEGGGEVRRSTGSLRDQRLGGNGRYQVRESYTASAVSASSYVHTRWTAANGASLVPGIRIDHRGLTGHTSASPWIAGLLPVTRTVTLRAGAGVYRQDPGFVEVSGLRGTPGLRTQRAYDVDAGVEGALGSTARWQATIYNREDRDVLRLPGTELRLVQGRVVSTSRVPHWSNALAGSARGVELLVHRRTPNGLSGWASYAYGFAHNTDVTTGETFWGDFDQRHTVNVYANYRFSDRLSTSARFRAGSNFPAPGYWREAGGEYLLGETRNALRIPPYSRLDVRANRTFTWERKRLTLFVEGLNVYNRSNVRFAIPSVNSRTLRVSDLFDTMVPIVPSAGILIEF